MFSWRPSMYPRSWREMSLEYKSMIVYHIGMLIMFMTGDVLTVPFEAGVALALTAIGVLLSLRHRRQVGWRWPGVTITDAECDFVAAATHEGKALSDVQPSSNIPRWHALVRIVCVVAFVVAWLDMAAFFYVSGRAFQQGSRAPTVTQTEPMRNHGTIVYVTPDVKAQVDLLALGQIGIPIAMGLAAFAHFVLGVKMIAKFFSTI